MKFMIFLLLVAETFALDSTTTASIDTTTVVTVDTTTQQSTVTSSASTTTSGCQDDPNVNCEQYKSLCLNGKYGPLLQKYCPKFCGYCGSSSTIAPPCVDSSTKCEMWKSQGYCENKFYSCQTRKEYCAATCGLCPANACS